MYHGLRTGKTPDSDGVALEKLSFTSFQSIPVFRPIIAPPQLQVLARQPLAGSHQVRDLAGFTHHAHALAATTGRRLEQNRVAHFIGNAGGIAVTYDGKAMPVLGKSSQVVNLQLP